MNIEHELGLIHFGGGGFARRKDTFLVLLAAAAIVYGALKLEQGEAYSEQVTARITQVDSIDYFGVVESLLHVAYTVDDVEYFKTLRTSGGIFFADQEVELVYPHDSPEAVSFAPPISASVDAWCCIAVGIAILMI